MILTKAEIAGLKRGHYIDYKVRAHEVRRLVRHPQVVKNKTVYDFAHRLNGQLDRHGLSVQDVRHIKNLIEFLKQQLRR
jgi:hypothetical protein